uniref:Uncharacterized protein n=1 Tax=Cacopsylla melanoneura TaxID=428564 RepID=A0A8D8MBV0_9HEMI
MMRVVMVVVYFTRSDRNLVVGLLFVEHGGSGRSQIRNDVIVLHQVLRGSWQWIEHGWGVLCLFIFIGRRVDIFLECILLRRGWGSHPNRNISFGSLRFGWSNTQYRRSSYNDVTISSDHFTRTNGDATVQQRLL